MSVTRVYAATQESFSTCLDSHAMGKLEVTRSVDDQFEILQHKCPQKYETSLRSCFQGLMPSGSSWIAGSRSLSFVILPCEVEQERLSVVGVEAVLEHHRRGAYPVTTAWFFPANDLLTNYRILGDLADSISGVEISLSLGTLSLGSMSTAIERLAATSVLKSTVVMREDIDSLGIDKLILHAAAKMYNQRKAAYVRTRILARSQLPPLFSETGLFNAVWLLGIPHEVKMSLSPAERLRCWLLQDGELQEELRRLR